VLAGGKLNPLIVFVVILILITTIATDVREG
jgi:hypothetical protein